MIGSADVGAGCGARRSRGSGDPAEARGLRALAGDLRVFAVARFGAGRARTVGFAPAAALARVAPARFSLRCPGRERGRFPSTPG